MAILVTGCAGFIGFHVTKALIHNGIKVIGVDSLNDYYDVQLKIDRLREIGIDFEVSNSRDPISVDNFNFYHSDISEPLIWEKLSNTKIDGIIHLAAQAGVRYSLENPMAYLKSNIIGFQRVIDFALTVNGPFIYASSSSVYGLSSEQPFLETESCNNPESFYAATKKSNEMVASSYFSTKNLKSVGLRFFTVYGPWGRPDMAPMLFAKAANGDREIKVFNEGNQSRDFTYITDIVEGILAVYSKFHEKIHGAEVLNIGRGEPVSLMEFINFIEMNFKIKFNKILMPKQPGDVNVTYASTLKLQELFGYEPNVSLENGISKFANWYKSYYK